MNGVSFGTALRFWFKLGFISFGGPAGQIAIMQRSLVDDLRWISQARFNHALNYCMVLPGPEAQQLATYIGWLMHGTKGGIAAGALFVLPSLFILMGLSWAYLAFGSTPLVLGVFEGMKAAVAALVLHAVWRVAAKVLKNPFNGGFRPIVYVPWALFAMSFVAMTFFNVSFLWIVAVAAAMGWWMARWPVDSGGAVGSMVANGDRPKGGHVPCIIDDETPTPKHAQVRTLWTFQVLGVGLALWAVPMLFLVVQWGWQATISQMAWLFTKAALVTFGGAYAVLPYVHQAAVEQFAWLSSGQVMAGLALGETTPGPLIMVVAFVAFVGGWTQQILGPNSVLLGAALAACVATWFTFLPSFVFILAGGPWVESTRKSLGMTGPLQAISAAVVGVMAWLAVVFVRTAVFTPDGNVHWSGLLIAIAAALALFQYKRGALGVIVASASAGLAVQVLG